MTNHSISNIATFNCKGFKYRNYDYLRKLYDKNDILLLQEHWLFDFECNVFHNILPDCQFVMKSGMQNDSLIAGRPYGGVAIIWKNSNPLKFKQISVSSKRLCAVQVIGSGHSMLIMSVYMPFNDANNEEFFDILCEINAICNTYADHDVIIGGDFNCDVSLGSLRASMLNEFIDSNEFLMPTLDPKYKILYTFLNSLNHRSLIDHFIFNSRINDCLVNCYSLEEGDNLSDHCPVIIAVCLNTSNDNMPSNIIDISNSIRKIRWHDATDDDKNNYRKSLIGFLDDICIPFDALNCSDFQCSSHNLDFNNFMFDIIEAIETSTVSNIPSSNDIKLKKNNKGKNIFIGWNSGVRSFRQQTIFWHNIWKECGRPYDGWVADIRRHTRFNYHQAIKITRHNKSNFVRGNVAQRLVKGNQKYFWREVGSIYSNPNPKTNEIDGKHGIDACNIFKDKYESLYNEQNRGSLTEILLQTQNNIVKTCKKCIGNTGLHLHHITPQMVKHAIHSLNRGKRDDGRDIYTDAFLEAPDKLYVYLAFLFTIMLRHGMTNDVFDIIVFSPLIKSKIKSLTDSDNFRAIALNSSFCKILDYIFLDYFEDRLKSSDYQFAYKKDFSTSLCTFAALETIQYYKSRGSRVIATLLDCSKAFDRVKYHKLFQLLIDRDICPLVTRLLCIMYSNIKAQVKWNNMYSNKFNINNGVKQGGVMSPILFTLYMDVLICHVINACIGCYIGNICSAIFIYADDIILLAPTRGAMQTLLHICEEFGGEFGLTYNPEKCEAIIFGDRVNMRLTLCNKELKFVNKVKHLGHTLCNNRDMFDFSYMLSDMKTRTNVIMSQFNFLTVDSRIKIFNTNCSSYYGSNLINLQSKDLTNLDRTWRVCSRRILNIPYRSHSNLIPSLMSTLQPSSEILTRMLTFYTNGYFHKSSIISFYFKNCFNNGESVMYRNLNFISYKLDENVNFLTFLKKKFTKKKLALLNEPPECWKIPFIREVVDCMHSFESSILDFEEMKNILEFLCTE